MKSLTPYLQRLGDLPFVKGARAIEDEAEDADAIVVIRTPTETQHLRVALFKSNLSRALAERAIARAGRKPRSWLVMAPVIGSGIGARLEEAGLAYVDRAGNCSLRLGKAYVAHIEGKRRREPDQAELKGLRAAAYKALFALLVRPQLLAGTVRDLAEAADVSRQAAHDMRKRLVAMGQAVQQGRRYRFTRGGLRDAFHLWLAGYAPTLRPSLFVAAYRTQDDDPVQLERQLEEHLDEDAFCWGGGAAAFRLTGYYRGAKTVIHTAHPELDITKHLRAAPAKTDRANLIVLSVPGPLGCSGPRPHLAHPLLAYAELVFEGRDRALEAAEELLARYPLEEAPE